MASSEDLNREQKINDILNERVGINEELVSEQQDIANVILDQVKNLEFAKIEQAKLRSITRDLAKTAQQNYSLSLSELGTKKGLKKLEEDRARVEKNIRNLRQISVKDLGVSKQLQKDIQDSIDFQVQKAEELKTQLGNVQKESNKIANNLGVKTFGGLQKVVKSIPGLKGLSKPFDDAAQSSLESAQAGESSAVSFAKGADAFLGSAGMTIGAGMLLNSLLKVNRVQTEFRRLTGESATNINTLNDSLISTTDQLQTMVGLTEQFGFNANVAFAAINIQEATELSTLMGLSAEEANNLAFFAQASGDNLKIAASNIFDGVDGAFSQKQILQEVGRVSNSIAMTFDGNLELMGETANEAKRLGLNLQQVDKIAEGLLDIETSIRNEFEAEVITGRQLNLERARFFALTNDLNGLTKEIGENQEFINAFSTGTRIEQQAIAESLNLSRDEVSKMIFDQAILNKLSAEEAAQRAGMSIEDAKRLTLQQSITKSVEKLTEALAGPLEAFASLADNSFILYSTLSLIAGLSLAKLVTSIITMGTSLASSAAAAGALKAFLSPAGLAISLASLALVGGAIGFAVNQAKNATKIQDGIAPASKGPFTITDSFGAMAITTKGDSLAVSPNIRDGRNDGMQIDYDKLASAIAKGAEAGTSRAKLTARVDNRQFAANQQTSQVIEQYKFSS